MPQVRAAGAVLDTLFATSDTNPRLGAAVGSVDLMQPNTASKASRSQERLVPCRPSTLVCVRRETATAHFLLVALTCVSVHPCFSGMIIK